MKFFWRFLIAILAVAGAVALANNYLGMSFARFNYWDYHGIFFLVAIAFFPRLTLLFSSVPSGGLIWWLGWIFAPRYLVALLATVNYWHQNPILVVMAWLVACGGESSEKYVVAQKTTWNPGKRFESAKWVKAESKS